MLDLQKIDRSWTLFLDRDGVINHEKHMDYVYNFLEFEFYDGVREALKKLAGLFGRIIIVTNQRGVEKNLMTEESLLDLHRQMLQEIEVSGGRIDAIYYCTSLTDDHPNRKPQPGMAHLAKESFPEIDFARSIMVGNNLSDMFFGRNAGMFTVFVQTTSPDQALPHPAIDLAFTNLPSFAEALTGLPAAASAKEGEAFY
jgi:D-glycero-D-manno-heptose 1,7-bisphosphate phosphatase